MTEIVEDVDGEDRKTIFVKGDGKQDLLNSEDMLSVIMAMSKSEVREPHVSTAIPQDTQVQSTSLA